MEFDFINETPEHRRVNRNTNALIQKRATKVGALTRREKEARAQSRTKSHHSLIKNAELSASVKSAYELQFGGDGVALALRCARPCSMADRLAPLDIIPLQEDLRTKLLNSEALYVSSKMCKILQLTDYKFLRHIPTSYGHCSSLDAAICGLMARIGDFSQTLPASLKFFDDSLDLARRPSTSFLYNQALKSLQTAIDTGFEKQITEVWYATMLLTLFELVSPSDEHSWVYHASGAIQMLKTLGPGRIMSEFQMSLLTAQCPIMVIETIMTNKPCYLDKKSWQSALQRTILHDRPFGERSQARVSLWCLNARVPTIFHDVTRIVNNQLQNEQLGLLIDRLIRDYETWHETWILLLENTTEISEFKALDRDFTTEMNIVYHAFSGAIRRLRIAIRPSGSLCLENEARDQSLNVLLKQDVDNIATGNTFAQGLFALQIMTAIVSTHDKWVEAVLAATTDATADATIEAGVFEEWAITFGRSV